MVALRYNQPQLNTKTPAQFAPARGMSKPVWRSTVRKHTPNPDQLLLFSADTLEPLSPQEHARSALEECDLTVAWRHVCSADPKECAHIALSRKTLPQQHEAEWVALDRAVGVAPGAGSKQAKFLYFMLCGDAVKVGVAVDPEARVRQIQVGNSEEVSLLASFSGMGHLEAECHTRLLAQHLSGEWFRFGREVEFLIAELDAEERFRNAQQRAR